MAETLAAVKMGESSEVSDGKLVCRCTVQVEEVLQPFWPKSAHAGLTFQYFFKSAGCSIQQPRWLSSG